MLHSIKAEAVSTGIDALLQIVQHKILHFLVGGVQVRQTGHAVLGYVKAVGVVADVCFEIMPAFRIGSQLFHDAVCNAVGSGFGVGHVIGHDIHNDLDAPVMGSLTHTFEIFLGSQSAVAGVVNDKSGRLVVDPPVIGGVVQGRLLGLLNGRGLDGGVA